MSRTVAIMGATGSIGRQTLDVIARDPGAFDLLAISGGSNVEELATIAREWKVRLIGVATEDAATALRALVDSSTSIYVGEEGLTYLSSIADIIVNGVVGFAGLPVTLSALASGKRLALANKESLIAAAPLVERVRFTPGAELLPVDSEHCAIHQCLASSPALPGHPDVASLVLTASGGPFRGYQPSELFAVTKADALKHPTWSMGAKITIDSSTLMNKGLEVLEASALFGIEVDRIAVVVHPQSIVHSMVSYVDGSTLAQLSLPDMRLPIAYCLGSPERLSQGWGALDFTKAMDLHFEAPDRKAFPALDLAYEAARKGGAAPAWLSAANEVAVEAFLADRIAWHQIVDVVENVLSQYVTDPIDTIEALYENDSLARRLALSTLPPL
jgi:1-deoxy-D-xylulose-5-phosphate reductoisomerase